MINCDVVSGSHCNVIWKRDAYYIQDIGSTYGTFYRISQKKLEACETYELGSVEIRVKKIYIANRQSPAVVHSTVSLEDLLEEGPVEKTPPYFNYVSLEMTKGGKLIKEFDIVESGTIGRKVTCSVSVVNDDHMSGSHCSIYFRDGSFWIEDTNSMNG